MRQVRFASAVAAGLALLATTANAAVLPENIGAVSLLFGSTSTGTNLDVAGAAVTTGPLRQISYDSQGNLYVHEYGDKVLRVDASTGVVTDVGATGISDGVGVLVDPNDDNKLYVSTWASTNCIIQSFNVNTPNSRTTLTSGHNHIHMLDYDVDSDTLYFPAWLNNQVRSVPKDGGSYAVVGSAPQAFAASVVQGAGHVFASGDEDTVRQIAKDGSGSVIVAGAASVEGDDDGAGTAARLHNVRFSTMSRDMQYLFLAESSDHRVRRMHASKYFVNTVWNPTKATVSSYQASYPDSLSARLNKPWSPAFNYAGDTLAIGGDYAVMTVAYTGTAEPMTTTTTTTAAPTTTTTTPEPTTTTVTTEVSTSTTMPPTPMSTNASTTPSVVETVPNVTTTALTATSTTATASGNATLPTVTTTAPVATDRATLPAGFLASLRAVIRIGGDSFGQLLLTRREELEAAVILDIARALLVDQTFVTILDMYEGSLVVDFAIEARAGVEPAPLAASLDQVSSSSDWLVTTHALYQNATGESIGALEVISVSTAAPDPSVTNPNTPVPPPSLTVDSAAGVDAGSSDTDDGSSTTAIAVVVVIVGVILVVGAVAGFVFYRKRQKSRKNTGQAAAGFDDMTQQPAERQQPEQHYKPDIVVPPPPPPVESEVPAPAPSAAPQAAVPPPAAPADPTAVPPPAAAPAPQPEPAVAAAPVVQPTPPPQQEYSDIRV